MQFNPRNILVIDFGQLGDVVLSLPALRAIREKFPVARITVAVGKACAPVVDLSGYSDATIIVDRVALRDGWKALSVFRIMRIVKEVRRAQPCRRVGRAVIGSGFQQQHRPVRILRQFGCEDRAGGTRTDDDHVI